MRYVFALLLCVLLIPYVGCGGGDSADTEVTADPNYAGGADTNADPGAVTVGMPGPDGEPVEPAKP